MTVLESEAAYRLWAPSYDGTPNPLLTLEERILCERLALTPPMRVLDLATGTGRWLEIALAHGADAYGVDLSREMLQQALPKDVFGRRMSGRLIQASVSALPFPGDFADLAICSFALSYVSSPEAAFREMARTSHQIVVSDLHPAAAAAGWARSFRANGQKYEIASHQHSQTALDRCAHAAGLQRAWQEEAKFGELERRIFDQAGKGASFDAMKQIPAILISCWSRQ